MTDFDLYINKFLEGKKLIKAIRASNLTLSLFYEEKDPNKPGVPPTKYKELNHIQVTSHEVKNFEEYVNDRLDGKEFVYALWLNSTDLLIFYKPFDPEKREEKVLCMELSRYDPIIQGVTEQ